MVFKYLSKVLSFITTDLAKLRSINVSINENSTWVQTGQQSAKFIIELQNKANLVVFQQAFLHRLRSWLGGHITGGAYGPMMRKYGLGADNVVDA